ncbi:MAG: enoyl-CoA hydratase/isomerase family protein [Anaerolineae bacterium]|nr:enoyl-CoA hydratase/isomerase family protein [Anaerolineae bacterium]
MSDTIQLTHHENGVVVITFNRPRAHNALTIEAMQLFQQSIYRLTDDSTIRAVILTGAGEKAFCSGGDLVELSQRTTEAAAREFITIMGDALLALERLPVPVIAAINGFALGGGSEIALACDIRIVDEAVKMGLVQIKMAVTPGWGAGQRLLRTIGYAKAMETLLRGAILRADDLLALGLANQVVATGQALTTALEFANESASQPPNVVRGIKALLQAGFNQPYEEALQTEREIFPPLWVSDAHIEAVEQFFQRQQAKNNGD